MRSISLLMLLSVLILEILAATIESISIPSLLYAAFGNQLGLFGSFDTVAIYEYTNQSSHLNTATSSPGSESLYFRNATTNSVFKVAQLNGLVSSVIPISSSEYIINGNFSIFNNQSVLSPIIFNTVDYSATTIRLSLLLDTDDLSLFTGTVDCMFKDNNLVYLGGELRYNNTHGVVIYDISSKQFQSTPFLGFGQDSRVKSITKVGTSSKDQGSIVFGGKFNTLGIPQLLTHSNINNTNSSELIVAEQAILLRHAIFSSVNGAPGNEDASIIDPSRNTVWSLNPDAGGEWLVRFPTEMNGLSPTKIRMYLPPVGTGIKTFRIYTQPNNGIMNLTYIDPVTNNIMFCDAWCPLDTADDLASSVATNFQKYKSKADDASDTIYALDGSVVRYYDPITRSKTLSYSAKFQEFAFVDSMQMDMITLTTIAWYGDRGSFSGLELYTDTITVYGNQTLNEPNSGSSTDQMYNNSATIRAGNFVSVKDVASNVNNVDYLVSIGKDAQIIFYPNILYTGLYLLHLNTPGCVMDGSCSKRSVVNATVFDVKNNILASKLIHQNNEYNKYDEIFSGHLSGSLQGEGFNRVEVKYAFSVDSSVSEPWTVIDSIKATIIDLNSTQNLDNEAIRNSKLLKLGLNGLFEYSLGNFSNFDITKVYNTVGNDVGLEPNYYVGESAINALSSQLSLESVIDMLVLQQSDPQLLLMLGEFASNSLDLTLPNSKLLSLQVSEYNLLSNQAVAFLTRKMNLEKRNTEIVDGTTFDGSISNINPVESGVILTGNFTLTNGGDEAVVIKDISNGNQSTNQINNFVMHLNGEWMGFGNEYIDADFVNFSNLTVSGNEYYVFSLEASQESRVWNTSSFSWTDNWPWNVTGAASTSQDQAILFGTSFSTPNFTSENQAAVSTKNSLGRFSFDQFTLGSIITSTYWVNSSLSIAGGRFTSGNISNIALLHQNSESNSISGLDGQHSWSSDAKVETLFVDFQAHFLYIGFLGSMIIGSANISGVAIYDLTNNSFTDYQPARLRFSDGRPTKINSIAFYEPGNHLLVGGGFDTAGSLSCVGLCIYDIANTRWVNPLAVGSQTMSGDVTTIKFATTLDVLLSGNLTIAGVSGDFASYSLVSGELTMVTSLDNTVLNLRIENFIVNDDKIGLKFNSRLASYGEDFVCGYSGTLWSKIDNDIIFDSTTKFHDLKLLKLDETNSLNNASIFDNNKVLALAGEFLLRNYGQVNVALYNGSNWIPFIYSSSSLNTLGTVQSLLIDELYGFHSSNQVQSSKKLSDGKVVGISLACALGSTAILGMLYLIPFFLLFRSASTASEQRIRETEMMDAVRPEDLFHEIDLQRHPL